MDCDEGSESTIQEKEIPCSSEKMSLLDISDYTEDEDISDDTKYALINNRQPPKGFNFPARQSKDKHKPSGVVNRYCKEEWFTQFDFISYSVAKDGIYCNNCLLFHIENPKPHKEKPDIMVKKPYTNWKKAKEDLKIHSVTKAHVLSTVKKTAFMKTYMKPDERIDNIMSKHVKVTVQKNRKFLTSIIKYIKLCGRNGMALTGHRDDSTILDKSHQGNFKSLLDFQVDAGDIHLKEHLETCARNASYISKTTQNQLLECIKEYVQDVIVN